MQRDKLKYEQFLSSNETGKIGQIYSFWPACITLKAIIWKEIFLKAQINLMCNSQCTSLLPILCIQLSYVQWLPQEYKLNLLKLAPNYAGTSGREATASENL